MEDRSSRTKLSALQHSSKLFSALNALEKALKIEAVSIVRKTL